MSKCKNEADLEIRWIYQTILKELDEVAEFLSYVFF